MPDCSQDDFKNLVNELPLGLLSCDTKGKITSVNNFLLKILGSPSAEATMKINMLSFPPLVESGMSAIMEEAIKTGKNISIETPYRSKWNKELFLSFKAFPRKDADGNVYGCHAIIEDLTIEKDTSSEIEYDRRKDNLISNISSRFINSNFRSIDHDINVTLQELAEFISCDRVTLFNNDENTDYIIKEYEWYVDGLDCKLSINERVDTKKIDFKNLKQLKSLSIPDVSAISDEDKSLQRFLQRLNVRSIAIIPLSRKGAFNGFITVDTEHVARDWDEKELYVLRIAGGMIANILERKETEKNLHEKEKEYENIISSLNSIIWKTTFDPEGNALDSYISKPLDEVLGFSEGSIGKSWKSYFDHIHEQDFPLVQESLKKAFSNPGTPITADYRVISDSGKIVWMNSLGSAKLLTNGNYLMSGTTTNVTVRKLAEEKLRENEELMSLFIEHAPASLAMFDRDMRYISVSNRWLSDIGLEGQDIIGMSHYDVIPEMSDEIKELHQRALKGEIIVREEDIFKLANGDKQWVHWEARPWKTVEGIISGIVIFAENITHRKEAEEEIKRNEEKYRALFEQSNDAILLLRYGGIIYESNNKALEIFECTEEDLHGLNIIDLFPPEMKSEALQNLELFRKGELSIFDFKAITFKNNIIDVDVSAKSLKDDKNVSQIVIRDITTRKKAVEDLKRNEEKYRSLFEQSNDAIFLNRTDGTIIDVNEKACEMFGYTKEELKKMNVVDLHSPTHINTGKRGIEDFRKTGVASLYTQYQKADGETFDAEVNAKIIEGEEDLAQGIIRDISERKKAEEEIIRSEMKYRALFEKSNDAVVIHDLAGKVLDVNDKACTIFGYPKEELVGINLVSLILPEDTQETISSMGKVKENRSWRNETRMIRSDGSIIHLDISGSLIETQQNIIQAVGRDITDRIKAEEAMLHAKIEAETASRAKSEFLATMSHELRTPLNSIIGFSDIMLDGMAGELVDKQEHYVQHISQSGHHLLNLINDILDISKIEAGKMELYLDSVDIKKAVSEIVTITESLASRKNITVDVKVPDISPLIYVDRSKLKQILYNLLGNAIKFTDNGGNVHIDVTSNDDFVTISITDTGIGISPDDQNKLFKPFSQIDASISRRYEGTGLGLALVKELIELHGGRIWVESDAGKGSTFTFELPIEPDRSIFFQRSE
nr:PAS domain S-box protein [uncultured Methanolobus sp.]